MTRSTPREQLLEVAAREGWEVLIDFGLHVELQRGPRRFSVQFDEAGRCTWCQDGRAFKRPIDAAIQTMIALVPRPKQGGHL